MPYVLIAYDISDDTRRLRVARILGSVLDRVQRSLFEGDVPDLLIQRIEMRARRLVQDERDSLRIYTLCGECRRKTRVYGRQVALEDPDAYTV